MGSVTVIDRAEWIVRTAATLPALAATAMALLGLAQARRQPIGRGVGTPYRKIPPVVYAAVGSVYTFLSIQGWRPLPFRPPALARWLCAFIGLCLYVTGMGFIFGGRFALADMYNLSATTGAELYANQPLVTTGPFGLVRHPMYFGALLAGLGALLVYRTWTLLLICVHLPVFGVRARREEEVLEQEFGEQWRAYRDRVLAGVPFLSTAR